MMQLGRTQEGLDRIQRYFHLAPPNEPAMGYAYLYSGEAELALGLPQNALASMLRANAFFPESPRILASLTAVYELLGDGANAARYAADFQRSAPLAAAQILKQSSEVTPTFGGPSRGAVLDNLRTALIASRS